MRGAHKESGPNRVIIGLLTAVILFNSPPSSMADDVKRVNLLGTSVVNGLPAGWEPVTFRRVKNHTKYATVEEGGKIIIHATADKSASAIVRRIRLDPKQTPILRWRWKISGIIEKGDETEKSGDDNAARVYVMFEYAPDRADLAMKLKYETARLFYGEYPPHSAINYIWANKLAAGSAVPNTHAGNAMMMAVRSGNGFAGEWVDEEANIHDDYVRLFHEEPPPISGVGIMTDSDNTESHAEAWFSEITISPAGKTTGDSEHTETAR